MNDIFQELNAVINGPGEFPVVAERYWERPVQILEQTAPGEMVSRADKLENLIDASLEKADELLRIPLDPLDENFVKLAGMQKDLVVSLISTGVKVDENRFRKKSTETLTALMAQIAAAENGLKSIPTAGQTVDGHAVAQLPAA